MGWGADSAEQDMNTTSQPARQGRLQRQPTSPALQTQGSMPGVKRKAVKLPSDVPFFKSKLSVAEEVAEFNKEEFTFGRLPENIHLISV